MKISHSKLALLLKDPMSYHIKYDIGISTIVEKSALSLGSAVHWGLEHGTDDLDEYYNDPAELSEEQALAESMVSAYLKHKDEIFDLVLSKKDGTKLKLLNKTLIAKDGKEYAINQETHELFIESELASLMHPDKPHQFIGIADLLLYTDEGIVLIDYKTSSKAPDWNGYLEQIYRYIFMLKSMFPNEKICKIGIINIRKAALRQKSNETIDSLYQRMKNEYVEHEQNYIYVHMFNQEDLNSDLVNAYIKNLSKMVDAAELIVKNKAYYINFGAQNDYGKAEYYDIFYKTPGAFALYDISDSVLSDKGKIITEKDGGRRPCNQADIDAIDNEKIINKYDTFKNAVIAAVDKINSFDKADVLKELETSSIIDHSLFNQYWDMLNLELSSGVLN